MKNGFNFKFDLFDGFPDMYFLVSNDGKILDLNKSGKALTGLTANAGNTNFTELIELCDRDDVIIIQQIFALRCLLHQAQLQVFFYIEAYNPEIKIL